MILTALSHALVTILCGLIGWWFGSVAIGLTFALGFYFGREDASELKQFKVHPTVPRGVWG